MKSSGIGCSELGDAFNLDYGCSRKLAYKKLGYKEDRPLLDDRHLRRGKALESVAIKEYERINDVKIDTNHSDILYKDSHCPLVCKVDGFLVDKVVEVKCPRAYNFNKVKKEGLSESYILQLQGMLYLTKRDKGLWIVFNSDSWDILSFEIEKNDELLNKIILKSTELWNDILAEKLPSRLELGDSRCKKCAYIDTCWEEIAMTIDGAIGESDLEDMTSNEKLSKAVAEYKEATENIKLYEVMKDASESEIKAVLGGRDKARCGESKIYHKMQSRISWDTKKLEKDKPELKELYKKESTFPVLKVIYE